MFIRVEFNLFLKKCFVVTSFLLIFILICIIWPLDINAQTNYTMNGVNGTNTINTKLKIAPTSIITTEKQELIKEIIVENVSELAGAEIHISFNPNILEVLALNDGQFMADSNKIVIKNYNNSLGQIDYTAVIFSATISGTGVLFSVRFRVKGKGTSSISFDFNQDNNRRTILIDSNNKPISFNIKEASVYVPTTISISPQSKKTSAGNKQKYQAFAICNGDLIDDITNSTIFMIDNGGTFTGNTFEAHYMGTWTITGKFFNLIGTTSVIVIPGTPTTLSYVSGNDQTAFCHKTLPEPLVVKVTDVYNNPVPNVTVDFSIRDHPIGALGVGLSQTMSLTSIDGLATSTLILGSEPPGTYTIEARNNNLSNSPIIFHAHSYRNFGNISGKCLFEFGTLQKETDMILVTLIEQNTTTTTNADSYFCFSNLPVGIYSLSFKYPGATPFTKTNVAITTTQFNDTTDIGTITLILGDANSDGQINVLEWPYIIAAFGSTKTSSNYNSNCDFNNDEKINVWDLLIFRNNFGKQKEQKEKVSIQKPTKSSYFIISAQPNEENMLINFSPQAAENFSVGETVTVDILISGGKNILCGELHLTYNKEFLEPKGVITQGNWPSQKDVSILANHVQDGKIDYAFGIMKSEENDCGILGTIKFVVKKYGSEKVIVDFDEKSNRKTIFVKQKGTQNIIPVIEAKVFTLTVPSVAYENLDKVYCYPNPVGKENKKVIFRGISGNKNVVLKIYNIAGELVYEETKITNADGEIEYELKNQDNKNLASGIYIWFLDDGKNKKKGKLGIIK